MKMVLLGGDERSIRLANLLLEDNHKLKVLGFNEEKVKLLELSKNLERTLSNSDIVIGPLPFSKDNILLNTPFYDGRIEIEEVFRRGKSNQIFIGGGISKEVKGLGKAYNIKLIDLMDREELAILNAIPTVEGAIQLAMEEIDTTIHGSNIMVLGFGRIGKLLARALEGLGGNVFVEARNHEDLAWIKAYGYKALHLKDIRNYLPNMDIVFNTIPSLVMGKKDLLEMKEEVLIMDLASKPGGVDFQGAKELGRKVIWALGLPGKVAPQTSAEIMKEAIYNILEEVEV